MIFSWLVHIFVRHAPFIHFLPLLHSFAEGAWILNDNTLGLLGWLHTVRVLWRVAGQDINYLRTGVCRKVRNLQTHILHLA